MECSDDHKVSPLPMKKKAKKSLQYCAQSLC